VTGNPPVVRNGLVITPTGSTEADVSIEGGLITSVGKMGQVGRLDFDATGLVVAPGLIDLQVNGVAGHDVSSHPDSIWPAGEWLATTGVTAYLPTVITGSDPEPAIKVMLAGPPSGFRGALPLGLHLEGPFLAAEARGTHSDAFLRPPSLEEAQSWAQSGVVTMVTLAPELPGATEVIRVLRAAGVVAAAGHSLATYDEAASAAAAGVTHGTHLFNAMPPLHHRAPGLAGFLLTEPGLTAGVIADGVHLHPAMVTLAWRALGPDRLVLVTDAVAAAGLGDGDHPLGPMAVTVEGGVTVGPDGQLAGSVLTLDQAVRNLVRFTGCRLDQAIVAASTVPARVIGDTTRGRVAVGARADLTIFDLDGDVIATIIGGQVVFQTDRPGAGNEQ
jgi:N-acetylglucosamine-6-phosphate deacetylase